MNRSNASITSTSTASTSQSAYSSQTSMTSLSTRGVDRTWPSISTTDTELTTPSLCSDNENDEVGPEDALPPTPPRRPPTPPRRSKHQRNSSQEPQVDRLPEVVEGNAELVPVASRAPEEPSPPSSAEAAFAKRPPSSPMPMARTAKPRPPARARSRIPSGSMNHDVHARHHARDYNPLKTAIPIRKKAVRSPGVQSKSVLHIQPVESKHTAHSRRRRTLDAELRRAGDHLWESDGEDADFFVTAGVKDTRGGFLARGGGAGSPVFMGDGYVQNYDAPISTRPSDRGKRY